MAKKTASFRLSELSIFLLELAESRGQTKTEAMEKALQPVCPGCGAKNWSLMGDKLLCLECGEKLKP
tara:strand:- start:318 stop:518 length:201 start_codon:yes stop_codon:yes gene_type:complete